MGALEWNAAVRVLLEITYCIWSSNLEDLRKVLHADQVIASFVLVYAVDMDEVHWIGLAWRIFHKVML